MGRKEVREMEGRVRELLRMIQKSAEIIRERQASKAFEDLIIMVGAENIIALSEEGIEKIDQQEGESPVNCQKTF